MPCWIPLLTDRLVTLAKRAVSGGLKPAVKKDDGGYADCVIAVIQALWEYLVFLYRRLPGMLHEMHRTVGKLNLEASNLADFTTICVQNQ